MKYKIIGAGERHRKDINRLIREAHIGSGLDKDGSIKNFWFVRDKNKRVIACCGLDFHNNVAILTSIVVKKEFRHQGIGATLISHRLNIARRRKAKFAALVTMYYHFNFYKRRGFRTCPRIDLPSELKDYWMFTIPRYKKCAVMFRKI